MYAFERFLLKVRQQKSRLRYVAAMSREVLAGTTFKTTKYNAAAISAEGTFVHVL
jgi:hypothetical protein